MTPQPAATESDGLREQWIEARRLMAKLDGIISSFVPPEPVDLTEPDWPTGSERLHERLAGEQAK